MGKPFDYNSIASNYSKTRMAVPWVLEPLREQIKKLKINSKILEIGCGTGNYIIEVSELLKEYQYFGFDKSDEMLNIAKSRSSRIVFEKADAEGKFLYENKVFDFCFAVDVIHHIVNIQNFFNEAHRCLKLNSSFYLVTDLEENIRKRSLSKFFPEILQVELDRYPSLDSIKKSAGNSGFNLFQIIPAEGYSDINDDFIEKVKSKCSSSMRLITDEQHKRGVERLLKAKESGEKWFSTYSIHVFNK